MRQRHGDKSAIIFRQSERARKSERGMDDSEMGELRAFRPPRRARGVEDDGDVFFTRFVRRTVAALFQQIVEGSRENRRRADGEAMRERGNVPGRGNELREIWLMHQNFRA